MARCARHMYGVAVRLTQLGQQNWNANHHLIGFVGIMVGPAPDRYTIRLLETVLMESTVGFW